MEKVVIGCRSTLSPGYNQKSATDGNRSPALFSVMGTANGLIAKNFDGERHTVPCNERREKMPFTTGLEM